MKLLGDQREKNYAYNINNSPNSTNKKKCHLIPLKRIFMKI